ncbi:MAG: HAMP domain-containing protein [Rhizobiaceae bacterium]|nr:HAMP domain-containing protein [Rhizobiaceae bacterium]
MKKMWSKLSIGKKLFIAMMITVLAVVVFIAVLVTFSMRAGFINYILQAELDRFDPLVERLVERHNAANPGWPELKGKRRQLSNLIRQAIPPVERPNGQGRPPQQGEQRPPPKRDGDKNRPPRRVAPGDPMSIAQRIALLGPDKNLIVGANFDYTNSGLRVIEDADGKVLGFISIVRPGVSDNASNAIFLKDQLRVLGLTLFMALLLSAVAAYLLARQFTKPVERLVSGTDALAKGKYDLRLEKTSEDEFGNLVEQFNKLAAQLSAQEKAERQWMSDTSHELQTPIAVLRAEIEAMQDGVRNADKKTLNTLHQSVTRLSALVKDISQLSNAREGRLVVNWTREDISVMAAQAAQKAHGLIEDAGLILETDLQDGLMADCDAMRIGQLLDNILTNARRYTHAPGSIMVSVKADDNEHVIIRVDDSNNCPPESAREKLFDRFYREDQSRARASGGSGLGLSICKLIVDAHNGEIMAEPSPRGGLAMIIKLPLERKK